MGKERHCDVVRSIRQTGVLSGEPKRANGLSDVAECRRRSLQHALRLRCLGYPFCYSYAVEATLHPAGRPIDITVIPGLVGILYILSLVAGMWRYHVNWVDSPSWATSV